MRRTYFRCEGCVQWTYRNCSGPGPGKVPKASAVPPEERLKPAFPEGLLSFKRMVGGTDPKAKVLAHLTEAEDPIDVCPMLSLANDDWRWVREFGFHLDGHAPPRQDWGRFYTDVVATLKSERGDAFAAQLATEPGA